MTIREGGSYTVGKSGEETLREQTEQPELHRVEESSEAPEAPTLPASDPASGEEKPPAGSENASRRRGGSDGNAKV